MMPFACRASTAIVQTPHSRMVAVTFKPQDLSLNKLQSISVPFIHWISRFFDTAPYEDLLSTGVVIAHKKACKHLPDVYSTKGFPPHLGAFCMRMCPFYRCFDLKSSPIAPETPTSRLHSPGPRMIPSLRKPRGRHHTEWFLHIHRVICVNKHTMPPAKPGVDFG